MSTSDGDAKSSRRWCAVYVVASCAANMGQGLQMNVVRPLHLSD